VLVEKKPTVRKSLTVATSFRLRMSHRKDCVPVVRKENPGGEKKTVLSAPPCDHARQDFEIVLG
jgi:hypothetical protein